jgi:hypothetical protein
MVNPPLSQARSYLRGLIAHVDRYLPYHIGTNDMDVRSLPSENRESYDQEIARIRRVIQDLEQDNGTV